MVIRILGHAGFRFLLFQFILFFKLYRRGLFAPVLSQQFICHLHMVIRNLGHAGFRFLFSNLFRFSKSIRAGCYKTKNAPPIVEPRDHQTIVGRLLIRSYRPSVLPSYRRTCSSPSCLSIVYRLSSISHIDRPYFSRTAIFIFDEFLYVDKIIKYIIK